MELLRKGCAAWSYLAASLDNLLAVKIMAET
jgi:hypothetical protein